MSPRSTLSLALCACLGLAGTASAQFGPNGPQRPGRAEMPRRFGSMIATPPKWAEYTVVSIAEEGKAVKKGDVVLVVKSAKYDAKLADLKFQQQSATADYEAAKMDRIIAELRLTEYAEGVKRLDIEQINGAIVVAEMTRKIADEKLAAAEKEGGGLPKHVLSSFKLEVLKAEGAYEEAMLRKKLMTQYTHPLRQKELEAAVEKAKAVEYRLKSIESRVKADLKAHEDEAAEFTIRAPHDGVVEPRSLRGMGGTEGMVGMGPGPRLAVGSRISMGGVLFTIRPTEKDKPGDNADKDEKPEEKK